MHIPKPWPPFRLMSHAEAIEKRAQWNAKVGMRSHPRDLHCPEQIEQYFADCYQLNLYVVALDYYEGRRTSPEVAAALAVPTVP